MNPQNKPEKIPFLTLTDAAVPGLFVKSIQREGHNRMKTFAHRDEYYMIVLITQGCASVSVDFEEITVSGGEAVIVAPSQVHFPNHASEDIEGWILGIAAEYFSEKERDMTARYSMDHCSLALERNISDDLGVLFEMLARHFVNYHVSLPIALSIKGLMISSVMAGSRKDNDRFISIVLRFKKMLTTELKREKSPSAYAGMLNITEGYLNEAVRRVTGMNVSAYIRSQVVIEAKRELMYTSLSAKEIAYSLGYDDYVYFSKLFKKAAGVSPVEYRKNLK